MFFGRKRTSVARLHLGCGPVILPGWTNVDNRAYPGVDRVLDVTRELPFDDVEYIFAEHFIEHLAYASAMKLLRECRRALRDDGVLRLSTPNLDWVWLTHYRFPSTEEEAVRSCFVTNRAFHGWGHQFLYNEATLRATLADAGFAHFERVGYGESRRDALRGLERHERSDDAGEVSHILILEAWGRGGRAPATVEEPRREFLRDVAVK
jgi:predicted SAM-dependent methyltransferase